MASAIVPSERVTTKRLALTNWRAILADSEKRAAMESALAKMLTPAITRRLPLEMDFPGVYGTITDWVDDRIDEAEIWCAHAHQDARLVGLALLFADPTPAPMPSVVIGYFLGEQDWGKGFGTEFVSALVVAIEKTGPVRLTAYTDGDNTASARVLGKAGFVACAERAPPGRLCFEKVSA